MTDLRTIVSERDLKQSALLYDRACKATKKPAEPHIQKEEEKSWKDHLEQLTKEYAARVTLRMTPDGETLEAMRTRYLLYDLVEDKIQAILNDSDKALCKVFKEIRDIRLDLFQELLADVSSRQSIIGNFHMPGEPISISSSQLPTPAPSETGELAEMDTVKIGGNGIAAFARARKKQAGDAVSEKSDTASTGSKTQFKGLKIDTKAYGQVDDDATTVKDTSSPNRLLTSGSTPASAKSPKNTNLVYGLSNSIQRGGPATLGAGQQEAGVRKPPPVSHLNYTNMYSIRLDRTKQSAAAPQECQIGLPGKELSLRQIREIMHTVYASKRDHDGMCLRANKATETMEQHLYKYLGRRYELKFAIQQWTNVIFMAIERSSPREADVAVFGKILQNRLSESYPETQDQLKKNLEDELHQQIKIKYPNKNDAEIEALYRARVRSGFPLSETLAVVNYMYNDADAEKIAINMKWMSENPQHGVSDIEPLAPDCVRLADMRQVVLSFQMALTESFLQDFRAIFREIDTGSRGALEFAELQELVERVGSIDHPDGIPAVLDEAKNTLITAIVKQKTRFEKGVTFSECVGLFTGLISARWGVVNPVL